jgi:hypothetical protein
LVAADTFDWSPMYAFPWATGAALLLVGAIYVVGRIVAKESWPRLFKPLTGLDSSWSFSDSWATNVTAGAGLLTATLGSSDLLSSILGDDGKAAVAGATVAGVIGAALVAAAGVVVLAFRTFKTSEFLAFGVLVGTILGLGAAAGQVWAVYLLLKDVDLGAAGTFVTIGAFVASGLLVTYTFTSLIGLMVQSAASPAAAETLTVAVPLRRRSALL